MVLKLVQSYLERLSCFSGSDDNAVGACAQLVFAPVDAAVSDDVPLLPSGFRVIPLVNGLDGYGSLSRTLDLASTLEGGEGSRFADDGAATSNIRSVLTMAFQFVFEPLNREEVAASARQYVRNVMVSVQSVAMALAFFHLGPRLGPRNVEALILAHQILRSYRVNFGLDLTESDPEVLMLSGIIKMQLFAVLGRPFQSSYLQTELV